ncbi:electron transport complex subunit RsxC [Pseudoalteromonas sp. MSK9-3]|uniref:electron transport complex subunit RsxC n=1 Tax=Pseudoalteromonas sp. MSK9-3 TaxID=1897633 RepID=UPI000E6C64EF|nr:electron transport complex subunit RsxC [Pseudoalteromonas sp. MSK9-3]RJE78290.1 electron transport complex subunit RsxC [Pseudoalteromonas sp. MSK9-3]
MDTLLEQIELGTLWQFPGGIHPPQQKTLSNDKPIARLALPSKLVLPLKQHIGANGQLIVNKGQHVLKGQALTQPSGNWSLPIHAPTSGEITDIAPMPSAHPSALPELSIILTPDGKDTWTELTPVTSIEQLSHQALIDLIHNAGIAGMGGAGFPTYIKADSQRPVEFLIVNGVECEPYITADDMLMREHAEQIVQGIEIMQHLLTPTITLIGIEDNKPEAVDALQNASKHNPNIIVRAIPTIYPSGGEKQLIKVLTSQEVPSGGIPADIGVLVQNVGTLFAVSEAVFKGKPLIERVVTVTGSTITDARNVWALIGTEIKHLLDSQGFEPVEAQRVVMGGPMMGFTLPTVRIPVVKTTNCILAPDNSELAHAGEEKACIRCSACADVCPQTLLPQQLQWFAKGKEYDKLESYNLFDCIECGACSYVCPSEIPLVQYYRVAKAEIREQKIEQINAERAKVRFEARKARLEQEQEERKNRHSRTSSRPAKPAAEKAKVADALSRVTQKQGEKSAVQAAIERAKAKKMADGSVQPDNSEMMQEREKRKEQARQYKAQKQHDDTPNDSKSAVAAAIARAKAKKAAKLSDDQAIADLDTTKPCASETPSPDETKADPRKAAVAAAIARAKAKKAAKPSDGNVPEEVSETAKTHSDTDPRKAAVAAAIERAKAKKAAKLAQEQGSDEAPHVNNPESGSKPELDTADPVNTEADADPRKAAVAAAIARAKAKKAAKLAQEQGSDEAPIANNAESGSKPELDTADSVNTEADADPRKAAVAAAIARAKAKKAAKLAQEQGSDEAPIANNAESGSKPELDTADPVTTEADADPRKAAVAAAIARAKAKKAAKLAQEQGHDEAPLANNAESGSKPELDTGDPVSTEADVDPRKAAVAAAIARAKAKKAAKLAQEQGSDEAPLANNAESVSKPELDTGDPVSTEANVDPRKAAVAAAIARAKAKKKRKEQEGNDPS